MIFAFSEENFHVLLIFKLMCTLIASSNGKEFSAPFPRNLESVKTASNVHSVHLSARIQFFSSKLTKGQLVWRTWDGGCQRQGQLWFVFEGRRPLFANVNMLTVLAFPGTKLVGVRFLHFEERGGGGGKCLPGSGGKDTWCDSCKHPLYL